MPQQVDRANIIVKLLESGALPNEAEACSRLFHSVEEVCEMRSDNKAAIICGLLDGGVGPTGCE